MGFYLDSNGNYYEGDRHGDDMSVPQRPDAEHAWNGNDWTPSPVAVPDSVTMRQARLALLQAGILTQVNAAVAAGDEVTRITWEFSSEVQRSNPIVSTLVTVLGLSEQQLDELFILAASL